MGIINSIASLPVPFLSLLLPFAVSMIIFALRLYHRIIRNKTGRVVKLKDRVLRIVFLAVFTVNVAMTLLVWLNFTEKGTVFYILSSNGWTNTIGGESKIRALLQIDAIGALSAVMMGLVAFSAALAALTDRKNLLSPTKAAFFMLTLCGIQGIFYSNGLAALLLFILFGQVGASGLYRGVPSGTKDLKRSMWYYSSRVLLLMMFFAGTAILMDKYSTDNIAILSNRMVSGPQELLAFILLVVPLLFLFLKNSAYVTDSSCRCFFGIRAQAAFFVIFRVIFSLYGSMPGLEKIPALFLLLGLLGLCSSLLLTPLSYDPVSFTEKMELYLKSLMLITLGLSLNGTYLAESMAKYGVSSIESMVSIWMLYLPLSAALSILCVNLKNVEDGHERWHYGCLYSRMPFTAVSLFVVVGVIGGLPPFAGFAAKQFLFRAANEFSSPLMIFVFAISLAILVYSVKYIAGVMFEVKIDRPESSRISEVNIALPLSVIMMVIAVTSFAPGAFFDKGISPAVNTLMNRTQIVSTPMQEGEAK